MFLRRPRRNNEQLQVVYQVDGERDIAEHTLDHLHGFEGGLGRSASGTRPTHNDNTTCGVRWLRLVLPAHETARPARRAAVADRQAAGRAGGAALAGTRLRDLGSSHGAPPLHVLQGHVLGRRAKAAPGWPRSGKTGTAQPAGRKRPIQIHADIRKHGVNDRGSSPSTTTPTNSIRPWCFCRCFGSCLRRIPASGRPCWRWLRG